MLTKSIIYCNLFSFPQKRKGALSSIFTQDFKSLLELANKRAHISQQRILMRKSIIQLCLQIS